MSSTNNNNLDNKNDSKLAEKGVSQLDDKTRIAPRKKIPQVDKTLISSSDKTRVASKRIQQASAKDGTVVAPRQRANPVVEEPIDLATKSQLKSEDLESETIINNRFILKESLGVGGMGMVFRAIDLRKQEAGDSHPYIAIKILTSEFEHHPQAFISLQREAQKSQILSHPNVITVYDFDRDGDLVYLTMEELKGQSLEKLLEEYNQGVPRDLAVKIIQGISEGMAYAHKNSIVHADLKPENVFYTEEGEVKIIDFGISRIVRDFDTKSSILERFDAEDEIDGLTPAYASLEMLRGDPIKPADDIYALGIISYQLLTGKHPFNKESADTAYDKKLSFKKITGLKAYQWKAINKALCFEQKDRIASGKEFNDLFSAKGRNVRLLTFGLIAISIIFAISLLIPSDKNMDHLYDELSLQQRSSYDALINEGNTLLGFNDWNNALDQFEQAFDILPLHSTTSESLDRTLNKIISSLKSNSQQLDSSLQIQQINELLKYNSLRENKILIEYRDNLKAEK